MSGAFTLTPDVLQAMRYLISGLQDPTVTATGGPRGCLFARVGESGGSVYVHQTDAVDTNWVKLDNSAIPASSVVYNPAVPAQWITVPTNVQEALDLIAAGKLTKVVNLVDAATIATDASIGNLFQVTLGGNRTLGAPTNPTDGQKVAWAITQDGTGGRTLAFNAIFRFGTDVIEPVLTPTPGATDYIFAVYQAGINRWSVLAISQGYL